MHVAERRILSHSLPQCPLHNPSNLVCVGRIRGIGGYGAALTQGKSSMLRDFILSFVKSMSSNGFSIRIFIPSGDPEGLRIIEKANWTGQGLVFPRVLIVEARKRDEVRRTGIYILWGPSFTGQLPRVYVGEGDPVLPRIDQHMNKKDFWTHAAVFTSKDQNLNKAHVQYLEARLVQLAAGAKRAELENGNVPQLPTLSEADVADAESFLQDLLLCLPVVGVSMFESTKAPTNTEKQLFIKAKGIQARGSETNEGFVVLAGSGVVKAEVPSISKYITDLRVSLIQLGVLELHGEGYRFTQDYVFGSPSMASATVLGRSSNGRVDWKDAKGRTLKELQEAGE